MKNLILKGSMLLTLLVMLSFTGIESTVSSKNVVGTWEYSAPDAPYEYQEGKIVFEMKENKLTGYVSIDGYKIEMKNIVEVKGEVTCKAYIEGESVSFVILFKKESFTGKASYSEGTLEITGARVKK